MNQDLKLISCWAKQWQVTFNPNKTEALFISNSLNALPPNLLFENVPVQFVESHKHLGLTLSSNGKWHDHIENLVKSATKILAMMRKIKFSVKRKTLEQMYVSFLRPILEYSSIVWDGCTTYEKDLIEKTQHEAARIVTGLTRSVSLTNLYKEINWISLSERRQYQKLILTFKIRSGETPDYVNELFPRTVDTTTPYALRNAGDFVIMNRRTELYSKSFVPSAVTLWNTLPPDIKSINTLSAFKHALSTNIFKSNSTPSYYYSGDRRLSVYHARLRNNCSNLNSDLFRNHLSLQSACDCGFEREDAEHYLLQCQLHTNERLKLFRDTRSFHPLNINILLFGSPELSYENNITLFLAVSTFIKDTNRFTTTTSTQQH